MGKGEGSKQEPAADAIFDANQEILRFTG